MKEESKKKKEEKSERERGGNVCEICVQNVIPPTLSVCNPNVVSGVKSCQSSNGQQTALCTEFYKKYSCIYLLYLFSVNE